MHTHTHTHLEGAWPAALPTLRRFQLKFPILRGFLPPFAPPPPPLLSLTHFSSVPRFPFFLVYFLTAKLFCNFLIASLEVDLRQRQKEEKKVQWEEDIKAEEEAEGEAECKGGGRGSRRRQRQQVKGKGEVEE